MDKVIIIGTDGKPKYELTDDKIIDLQEYCECINPKRSKTNTKRCLICGKVINGESTE